MNKKTHVLIILLLISCFLNIPSCKSCLYCGLIGWWKFNEGAGNTAYDSSSYANHGTVYGATWVDGRYGKALSFDGTDDYVEIQSSDILVPSEITIAFWVKMVNPLSEAFEGFVCRNSRINGLQVIKFWSYGFISFEGWIDGTYYNVYSNYIFQSNIWTHVVATASSDGVWKIYVNGQFDNQSTGNILPQVAMPLWIGRTAQGTTNPYLNGTIDEVHIYNRVLSADEIQDLFFPPEYILLPHINLIPVLGFTFFVFIIVLGVVLFWKRRE